MIQVRCLLSLSLLTAIHLAHRIASAADPDLTLICEQEQRTLVEHQHVSAPDKRSTPPLAAEFLLNETGAIEVGKSNALRFCLSMGKFDCDHASTNPGTKGPEIIVRIDRAAPRGRRSVACQRISAGTFYEFGSWSGRPMRGPDAEVRKGDVLTVSSYGPLDTSQQKSLEERRSALSEAIGQTEAKVVRNAVLKDLIAKPAVSIGLPDVTAAQNRLNASRAAWSCAPPPAPPLPYPGSEVVCRQLDETALALRELEAKLPGDVTPILASLVQQGAPPGTIPKEHCERVAKHRWLSDSTRSRLLTRHAISDVPADELLVVSYDLGTSDVTLDMGTRPVLLVTGVPANQPLRFTAKSGELLLKDPATLIAGFLESVLPLAAAALKGPKLMGPLPTLCTDNEQRLDDELAPLAPVGSRVFAPREALHERALQLSVCAGTECKLEGDGKNLTNTVTVSPQASVAPIVLLGLGTTMRFDEFGKLTPQGPSTGPDQVFEFRDGDDIGVLPTIDALIGVRTGNMLFALGPALAARGIPAFKHWKLLLGAREPSLSRFLYFAAHVSVTLESQLQGARDGDRWVVPIGASGSATPPQLQAETRPRFGLGLTLGLDLAATTDAGEKLIAAVRGETK